MKMVSRLVLSSSLLLGCGTPSSTPGGPGAPGQPATAVPVPGMPVAVPTPAGAPATAVPGSPAVPQNPFQALGQMAQAMQSAQAPMAGQVVNWRNLAEALPTAIN